MTNRAARRRSKKLAKTVHKNRVAAAMKETTTPSEAQYQAGNWRKGKVPWHGLTIRIEYAKGSLREFYGTNFKPQECTCAYGHVLGTKGIDGDPVDVLIGDHPDSEIVFVIDSEHQSGRMDEHKVVIGCTNTKDAKQLYRDFYPAAFNVKIGHCAAMTVPQFKQWLEDGTKKRVEGYKTQHRYAEGNNGVSPIPYAISAPRPAAIAKTAPPPSPTPPPSPSSQPQVEAAPKVERPKNLPTGDVTKEPPESGNTGLSAPGPEQGKEKQAPPPLRGGGITKAVLGTLHGIEEPNPNLGPLDQGPVEDAFARYGKDQEHNGEFPLANEVGYNFGDQQRLPPKEYSQEELWGWGPEKYAEDPNEEPHPTAASAFDQIEKAYRGKQNIPGKPNRPDLVGKTMLRGNQGPPSPPAPTQTSGGGGGGKKPPINFTTHPDLPNPSDEPIPTDVPVGTADAEVIDPNTEPTITRPRRPERPETPPEPPRPEKDWLDADLRSAEQQAAVDTDFSKFEHEANMDLAQMQDMYGDEVGSVMFRNRVMSDMGLGTIPNREYVYARLLRGLGLDQQFEPEPGSEGEEVSPEEVQGRRDLYVAKKLRALQAALPEMAERASEVIDDFEDIPHSDDPYTNVDNIARALMNNARKTGFKPDFSKTAVEQWEDALLHLEQEQGNLGKLPYLVSKYAPKEGKDAMKVTPGIRRSLAMFLTYAAAMMRAQQEWRRRGNAGDLRRRRGIKPIDPTARRRGRPRKRFTDKGR